MTYVISLMSSLITILSIKALLLAIEFFIAKFLQKWLEDFGLPI